MKVKKICENWEDVFAKIGPGLKWLIYFIEYYTDSHSEVAIRNENGGRESMNYTLQTVHVME